MNYLLIVSKYSYKPIIFGKILLKEVEDQRYTALKWLYSYETTNNYLLPGE